MKADVLALVQTFAAQQADAQAIDRYYTDIVRDLATHQWLTNATLVPAITGTAEYLMSPPIVAVMDVIYDNSCLDLASLRVVETVDVDWRNRRGRPIAYVVEQEPADTIRLYPAPDGPSGPFIWLHGSPSGLDYPADAVCVFHTETREDVPAWLEVPIALRVCALEFERESNHRDPVFAKACDRLSTFLLQVVS